MAGCVAAQRKYRYGVSREDYAELLEQQGGKCAGCGNGETMLGRGGEVRSLGVDHCHTTGKIRGLLCDMCNNIVGRAKDSPATLRRLAAYLEVADTGRVVPNVLRANHRENLQHSRERRKRVSAINADVLLEELAAAQP